MVILFSSQLDSNAQSNKIIRGTILEVSTGEPVIGATVVEYDDDNRIISGAVTDVNGNFQISVKDPDIY